MKLKNLMLTLGLLSSIMIACDEEEPVQTATPDLEGQWVLNDSAEPEIMDITNGYVVYYAQNGGIVTEALPYQRNGASLKIDGQNLEIKTLTRNQLTIVDVDGNDLSFRRDATAFGSLRDNTFGGIASEAVISNAVNCDPAVWTAEAVATEITNGDKAQLNISKSAGVSGSIEVWFFTLPKTPAAAGDPYHLITIDQGCDGGEVMVETEISNQSEGPAEIEVRLRRPTLNLQVGTPDFRIEVQ